MIGVVGSDPDATARLADVVGAAGTDVRVGDAREVTAESPTAVVAIGDAAAVDLVRSSVDAPLLPIDAGPGFRSVPRDRAAAAIERVIAGDYTTCTHPVLEVSVGGDHAGRALFDAMLVTESPARISEYAVAARGPIAQFRADGVVVATPAGSSGYARAAGGPIVGSGSDAVAVVPVAPFAIRIDHWVVDVDAGITLTVERGDGSVQLLLDGRPARRVPPDRPVTITRGGAVETIVVRSTD